LDERFKPKDNQIEILKEINLVFNEKNNCVVLIIGEPGIGKSRVSLLLSQQLNCCVLDCSVSTIDNYYKKYYVDNNPIIFIIDEVDIELESIENVDLVNISRKDEYVFTKKEWNTVFDHIDLGFYPGLIILMTSNKINDKYNSELRRGRIDIKYTMTN
jgi:ABC-type lipoprotein export system ATPase subunit